MEQIKSPESGEWESNQGISTTKFFQISSSMSSGERCLKWFPLCFRSLFGKFVAALKTIICSDVSLIVLKVEKGIYSVGDTGGSEEKFSFRWLFHLMPVS